MGCHHTKPSADSESSSVLHVLPAPASASTSAPRPTQAHSSTEDSSSNTMQRIIDVEEKFRQSPLARQLNDRLSKLFLSCSYATNLVELAHLIAGELQNMLTECEEVQLLFPSTSPSSLNAFTATSNSVIPLSSSLSTMFTSSSGAISHYPGPHDIDERDAAEQGTTLCRTPIMFHQQCIGVIQCAKLKRDGVSQLFSAEHQLLFHYISVHVALYIHHHSACVAAVPTASKLATLLEVLRQLPSPDLSPHSLIFTLTSHAHRLVDATRTTLYLVHAPSRSLVVMQGNLDFKLPIGKGIAGKVAETGETVRIEDCRLDSRFDSTNDTKTGFVTKSMVCIPIFRHSKSYLFSTAKKHHSHNNNINNSNNQNLNGIAEPSFSHSNLTINVNPTSIPHAHHHDDAPIGVLQVINKLDSSSFTQLDEDVLALLIDIAGPLLARTSFFTSQTPHLTEFDKMNQHAITSTSHKHNHNKKRQLRRVSEFEAKAIQNLTVREAKQHLASMQEEESEDEVIAE